MPRLRVIVLDSPDVSQAGRANFRLALWADVPASRQVFYAALAGPDKQSAWLGATLQDNQNLQTGLVAERVVTYAPDTTKTAEEMEADAQNFWISYQDEITNTNKWPNYGSTWDGDAWNILSVA